MKNARTVLGAVSVAGLLACGDAKPTVSAAPPPMAADAMRETMAMLDDAASRSSVALEDARVSQSLQRELSALSDAVAGGHRDAALFALPHVRHTLAEYSMHAGLSDAADRAVISLALDRTEQLLRADADAIR